MPIQCKIDRKICFCNFSFSSAIDAVVVRTTIS